MLSISDRIDKFSEENELCYLFDGENGFYTLGIALGGSELANSCQRAFDAYARQIGEPALDGFGLHRYGSGYNWEAVFREAFRDDPNIHQVQFDSEAGCFYCFSEDLDMLEDFGKRFRDIFSDYDRFASLIPPAMEHEEQRPYEKEYSFCSVREFLLKYPEGTFSLETPEGYVTLEPEDCKRLLHDQTVNVELSHGDTFSGQWLLEHGVTKYSRDSLDHDFYRVQTDGFQLEQSPELSMV